MNLRIALLPFNKFSGIALVLLLLLLVYGYSEGFALSAFCLRELSKQLTAEIPNRFHGAVRS